MSDRTDGDRRDGICHAWVWAAVIVLAGLLLSGCTATTNPQAPARRVWRRGSFALRGIHGYTRFQRAHQFSQHQEVAMLVREHMTHNPITATPDMTVPDALRLMRERKVRRLPVLDKHGRLVGIVSDKDLLYASPSPATTLAVWEIPELLAKIRVEQVMTREVVTVSDDTPLEEAARIMADRSIGCLPVMQNQTIVGIITETDLFKVFLQLLGGRRRGVRVTVSVPDAKGTLAKVTAAIFGAGGDIVGFGISENTGTSGALWAMTVKVQDVPRDKLIEVIRPVVHEILDVREM